MGHKDPAIQHGLSNTSHCGPSSAGDSTVDIEALANSAGSDFGETPVNWESLWLDLGGEG